MRVTITIDRGDLTTLVRAAQRNARTLARAMEEGRFTDEHALSERVMTQVEISTIERTASEIERQVARERRKNAN